MSEMSLSLILELRILMELLDSSILTSISLAMLRVRRVLMHYSRERSSCRESLMRLYEVCPRKRVRMERDLSLRVRG